MGIPEVDWGAVDAALPSGTDPASRALRGELFQKMDPNENGLLSLTEVQGGLPVLLETTMRREAHATATSLVPSVKDFKPAIKAAFNAARNLSPSKVEKRRRGAIDTNVDVTEFHALLVAFRQFLELEVVFTGLDRSRDRRLNYKEVEKALPLLASWGLTKKQVRAKFPDEWTACMEYDDFSEWLVSVRFGTLDLRLDEETEEEERERRATALIKADAGIEASVDPDGPSAAINADLARARAEAKLHEEFKAWDTDGNGSISHDELSSMLLKLDPTFTPEGLATLFASADGNRDGKLDYTEFCKWVMK